MGRLSVILLVCCLAGLCDCQAGGEGNEVQTAELTHEDQASDRRLQASDRRLEASDRRLEASDRRLHASDRRLEASEQKLSAFNKTVTQISTVLQGKPQVAFSVALPVDGTIGPANVLHPLVNRQVLSNIGGHYSRVTGYFTAPVRGVYYFTFTSLCWYSLDHTCGGSLYHNGNSILSWYCHPPTDPTSASNSGVLWLPVGDKVNVCLWPNGIMSDNVNKYSSFTGFLLFSMWRVRKCSLISNTSNV
uniref:C1q domain-containing protein n=1 Tax=Scophthalmus maximus TaxID=52904 RepID=A0A8D3DWF0_SCOMX